METLSNFLIGVVVGILIATIAEGINYNKIIDALFGELPDDEG